MAHRHRLAKAFRYFRLAGGGAALARILEHVGDDLFQAGGIVGELVARLRGSFYSG